MVGLGFVLFGALFVLSGLKHIQNHGYMSAFATTAFGNCPFAKQLGYIGGWPSGLYLAVVGILVALGESSGFYGAVAFLVPATLIFHRDVKTDVNFGKNLALIGAALAISSLI